MKPRIPPYGKGLFNLIQRGMRPANDIRLFFGTSAWERARSELVSYPGRILVLPWEEDPAVFLWPVKECSILMFDTCLAWAAEPAYVDRLAACLYRDRASRIIAFSEYLPMTFYHKEM